MRAVMRGVMRMSICTSLMFVIGDGSIVEDGENVGYGFQEYVVYERKSNAINNFYKVILYF